MFVVWPYSIALIKHSLSHIDSLEGSQNLRDNRHPEAETVLVILENPRNFPTRSWILTSGNLLGSLFASHLTCHYCTTAGLWEEGFI